MRRRPFAAGIAALAACLLAAAPAFACIGQIKVSLSSAEPGAPIQVRGYGFWADPRPVTLTWDDGAAVATVQPDASGVFNITLTIPQNEGFHRLVATQGENDPEPAYNILQVVRAAPATDTTAAAQATPAAEGVPAVVLASRELLAVAAASALAMGLILISRLRRATPGVATGR